MRHGLAILFELDHPIGGFFGMSCYPIFPRRPPRYLGWGTTGRGTRRCTSFWRMPSPTLHNISAYAHYSVPARNASPRHGDSGYGHRPPVFLGLGDKVEKVRISLGTGASDEVESAGLSVI